MSNCKLSIAFYIPGMPFHGHTLKEASLGGSETAGLCMARELAKRGHQVYVFANTIPGTYDGVDYYPIEMWDQFAITTPHDVSIVQRVPEKFTSRLASRLNVLWCHDMAMGRDADRFRGVLWNVDQVCLLSDYHVQQYKDAISLEDSVIFKTRNGIDLDMFPDSKLSCRDRKVLMYCARPERGLDRLLKNIFPKILAEEPDAILKIASYDHKGAHFEEFYRECSRLQMQFGDRVQNLGPLTKPQLYEEYAKAGCYVYPTPSSIMPGFREISCITLMECQAAGLPVVATNVGALAETLASGAGMLIDDDENHDQHFVNAVVAYMRDVGGWSGRAGSAGRKAAQDMDWSLVAEEWDNHLHQCIANLNDSPERLARHFIKHSNIIAAREAVRGVDSDEARSIATFLDDYPVTDYTAPREYIDQFQAAIADQRYQAVRMWAQKLAPKTLLDAACGQGIYATALSTLGIEVTGIDLNPSALEDARRYNDEYQGSATFFQESIEAHEGTYDAAIALEILEHVEEPWKLLESVEAKVKSGGQIFITVPYGPWEWNEPVFEHLWEFDQHDIRDMVGHKPGFSLNAAYCEARNGIPLGHYYICYTVDHSPIGKIDMARKLYLQRPMQTVTASLIGGPNVEETLLWCLKSIRPVVDKIVVGDTGMSDLARAMAENYGALIVPAPNPLEEGFECARNATLPHIDTDWVFWIDTDEKLLDAGHMVKYLRENVFNGYGIRQHHFAVDTVFNPDMPVRLFRNRPYDGKDMKWWGAIHEHPELGLNEGPGPVVVTSDVHIAHMGYLVESGRKLRFLRNHPLLELDIQRNPDRILQKHFICRDNMLKAANLLQSNGMRMTDEIMALCDETIALYREHFLGKPHYVNIDTLQYYSQALQIKGEGFDVEFEIKAAKDGHGSPLNGNRVRFANKDDLTKEVMWRAQAAAEPYERPNF